MSPRLLSFLTDIERALLTEEPAPQGAVWENVRTINYHHGLARLALAARSSPNHIQPLGSILLQSYTLADGKICLKAFLSWTGSQTASVHAIYERPDSAWTTEARRVSSEWLAGRVKGSASGRSGKSSERMAAAG